MEQMYLEGISTGRELNREDLHVETEKYIKQKMTFLTNYFLVEDIWQKNPPAGYDPKMVIPKVEKPECDPGPEKDVTDDYGQMNSKLQKAMSSGEMPQAPDANQEGISMTNEDKPDWAKEQEVPEWASEKTPFK